MEVESDDAPDPMQHVRVPHSEIIQICEKLEMVCLSESDADTSLELTDLLCKFHGESVRRDCGMQSKRHWMAFGSRRSYSYGKCHSWTELAHVYACSSRTETFDAASYVLSHGYAAGFKLVSLNACLAALAAIVSIKHQEVTRGDEEKLKADALAALGDGGKTRTGDDKV